MSARILVIFVLVATATALPRAGVVPGRWEKVEALEEGYAITVKLDSGERFKASYVSFTDEAILLKRDSGEELEVPKAAVGKITSQSRDSNDGLRNGAIIGAVAGGVLALGAGLELADGDDYGVVLAITALYAAIGMGVGVGIDAIVQGHEVLYQARGE